MSLSLAHLLYSVTWSQCPTACVHVKHSSLTSTTAPPARVSILVVDENNYQDKRGSTLKWSMSTSSSLSSLLNEMSLKHGGNFFTTSRWRQYHFLLPVHKIIHTSVFNKWRQSVDSVPAFLMTRTHQNSCRLNVVCKSLCGHQRILICHRSCLFTISNRVYTRLWKCKISSWDQRLVESCRVNLSRRTCDGQTFHLLVDMSSLIRDFLLTFLFPRYILTIGVLPQNIYIRGGGRCITCALTIVFMCCSRCLGLANSGQKGGGLIFFQSMFLNMSSRRMAFRVFEFSLDNGSCSFFSVTFGWGSPPWSLVWCSSSVTAGCSATQKSAFSKLSSARSWIMTISASTPYAICTLAGQQKQYTLDVPLRNDQLERAKENKQYVSK